MVEGIAAHLAIRTGDPRHGLGGGGSLTRSKLSKAKNYEDLKKSMKQRSDKSTDEEHAAGGGLSQPKPVQQNPPKAVAGDTKLSPLSEAGRHPQPARRRDPKSKEPRPSFQSRRTTIDPKKNM